MCILIMFRRCHDGEVCDEWYGMERGMVISGGFSKSRKISGCTHPILLQFKQLPQPLQEDRLRDLKMVKTMILSTCKVFAATIFTILGYN